jgi:hypothetical protein
MYADTVFADSHVSRALNSGGGATELVYSCDEYYLLSYATVLAAMLCLFITSVHITSCHYYDKLVGICLTRIGVDMSDAYENQDLGLVGPKAYETCEWGTGRDTAVSIDTAVFSV